MSTIKQNYINHIALVLDSSESMRHLRDQVIKVADEQIKHLAQRSKELDQETRITVYKFADTVQCLVYDKDVLRMPSLSGVYDTYGWTALLDASEKALDDLSKTPELYGDHAFLMYVITDGNENKSRTATPQSIKRKIESLKDNWTVAVFVPDQVGKFEAKKYGFPQDNIAIWSTDSKGMAEVGEVIRATTDTYMAARAVGTRSMKNLFSLNTAEISKQNVSATMAKLHPGQYRTAEVTEKIAIAPFVEKMTNRPYRMGEGYYQLSKPEKIQPDKKVVLLENKTKHVYVGDEARSLLSLPDHEVKVAPASHPDFTVFVQSKSVNRNLVPGTRLLLLS